MKSGVRIAYDSGEQKSSVEGAIQRLQENGISKRKVFVYTLFNYNDSPEEFLERVINILNWGAICYPMRYEPVCALEKNHHITKLDKEAVRGCAKGSACNWVQRYFPTL